MKNAARRWMQAAVLSAASVTVAAATPVASSTVKAQAEPAVMLLIGVSLIAIGLFQRRRAA